MDLLPKLEVVSKYGVGTDMIDFQAMKKHKVKLGWTGGVNRRAVSELVICYAISILRDVPIANKEVTEGIWKQHKCNLLSEKSFGIIGFGNIGQDVARLLEPFACKVLVYDIVDISNQSFSSNVEFVTLDYLLKNSDLVSLHLPLNDDTALILNKKRLNMMQKHSVLINLSRGGLVDEDALKEALMNYKIRGAAFDVFAEEPPKDQDLLNLDNFLSTPHIGGLAKESIMAMGYAAIDGLDNNSLLK